jgi:hypothetical protein
MSEALRSEFEKLKQDLIIKHDEKGMRASGEFAESLEVISGENNVSLFGAGHAVQLEQGRGATQSGASSTPTLREQIRQWIDDKGIQSDISKDSLAFLIARKIHAEGWDRKDVNLISEVITPERVDQIIEAYKQEIGAQFIAVLTQNIRKI